MKCSTCVLCAVFAVASIFADATVQAGMGDVTVNGFGHLINSLGTVTGPGPLPPPSSPQKLVNMHAATNNSVAN